MSEPIVKIIKEPDDPLAYRISCGGRPDIGYYCVYRGDMEACKIVLRLILQALESIRKEPKVAMQTELKDGPEATI